MTEWLLAAVAVFASGVALDYADSSNTRAVAEGRAHAAARWSLVMYVVGSVGFLSVVRWSLWFMVPECAGLYLGSWLAVRQRPPIQGPPCGSRETR